MHFYTWYSVRSARSLRSLPRGETTTLLRFQQLEKLFFVHMHIIIGFVIGCKITAFLQILQYAI
jgi:hypothetical protein